MKDSKSWYRCTRTCITTKTRDSFRCLDPEDGNPEKLETGTMVEIGWSTSLPLEKWRTNTPPWLLRPLPLKSPQWPFDTLLAGDRGTFWLLLFLN